MTTIINIYELGQTVYLVTDPDQVARMVTGFILRPSGLLYIIALGTAESNHYELELCAERDVVKATSN